MTGAIDVDLTEVHRVLTQNLEDFEEFAYYVHTYSSKEAPKSPGGG